MTATTARTVYKRTDTLAGTNAAKQVYVLAGHQHDDGYLRVYGGLHTHPHDLDEGEWVDARHRIFRPDQLAEVTR